MPNELSDEGDAVLQCFNKAFIPIESCHKLYIIYNNNIKYVHNVYVFYTMGPKFKFDPTQWLIFIIYWEKSC